MVYAVDFDGTLCEDAFPEIGAPRFAVIEFVKAARAAGDKVILWTCRVDDRVEAALAWCAEQGLVFDAVNDNLPELIGTSTTRRSVPSSWICFTGCCIQGPPSDPAFYLSVLLTNFSKIPAVSSAPFLYRTR